MSGPAITERELYMFAQATIAMPDDIALIASRIVNELRELRLGASREGTPHPSWDVSRLEQVAKEQAGGAPIEPPMRLESANNESPSLECSTRDSAASPVPALGEGTPSNGTLQRIFEDWAATYMNANSPAGEEAAVAGFVREMRAAIDLRAGTPQYDFPESELRAAIAAAVDIYSQMGMLRVGDRESRLDAAVERFHATLGTSPQQQEGK